MKEIRTLTESLNKTNMSKKIRGTKSDNILFKIANKRWDSSSNIRCKILR